MAHITLPDGAPRIIGPMIAYPETELPTLPTRSGASDVWFRGRTSIEHVPREPMTRRFTIRS